MRSNDRKETFCLGKPRWCGVYLASNFYSLFGKNRAPSFRGSPVKQEVKAAVAQATLPLSSDGHAAFWVHGSCPKWLFLVTG